MVRNCRTKRMDEKKDLKIHFFTNLQMEKMQISFETTK